MPIADARLQRSHELRCPHCLVPGARRSSREIQVTMRQISYSCRNPACGHTWRASLIYDYGLSPSAIPNPTVNLRMRPMDRGDVIQALSDANAPLPDPAQPGLFDTG